MSAKPLPPKPQWETVPKGTPSSTCRGPRCHATVYWISRESRAKKSKGAMVRIPVDCDVEGGSAPDSLSDGKGVNHHQTCSDAGNF